MRGFINNPSIDKLVENLQVLLRMESYRADGYSISIENGMVYAKGKDNKKTEIGELPSLAEATRHLFGDTIPEGVEYISIKDITIMTYYGNLIGCGYVENKFELHHACTGIMNGNIAGVSGSVFDELAGKPVYGTTSMFSAIVEALLGSSDTTLNYDNIIGQLVNLRSFTGGTFGIGYRINDYIAVPMEALHEIYWYYGGHTS